MSVKIKDLVNKLKEKDQDQEVEFIVAGVNGELVCMDVSAVGYDMHTLLKVFSQNVEHTGNDNDDDS